MANSAVGIGPACDFLSGELDPVGHDAVAKNEDGDAMPRSHVQHRDLRRPSKRGGGGGSADLAQNGAMAEVVRFRLAFRSS